MFFKTCLIIALVQAALSLPVIPPVGQTAARARYVVHAVDWASVGTISTQEKIQGYPFVGIKSISDGSTGLSSGVPYMMLTELDLSEKDLMKDNRFTLMMSLAETDYCKNNNLDPMDPRCARVMLTGKRVKVDPTTVEHAFAKNALIERHPSMADWPEDHGFYIAKIDIEQIAILDHFGGVEYVPFDDYIKAKFE